MRAGKSLSATESVTLGHESSPDVLQDRKANLAEGRRMISFRSPVPAEPSATRVGADLRTARENIGWTLPAVAAHLRIRLPYLEAIEEGRIGDLPGNAYALGFLRTYAGAVGLDPDEIARRFRAEAAEVNRKTELSFPAPVPERGIPAGALMLLSLVLAVGAYAFWYRASSDGQPAEPVRAVPERLAELVTPPAAPVIAEPSVTKVDVAHSPDVAPAPVVAVAPSPPAISPIAAAAAVPQAAPEAPALPDGTRLVLRAKADAWMQVRDRQGNVLLNRVLRAGETWPAPPKIALLLTTGNAGGTEILVDGQATAALGGDGVVRRDLLLDIDQVKDGRLAPQAAVPVVGKPTGKASQ